MTIRKVWKYFVRAVLGSLGICVLLIVGYVSYKQYVGIHCVQGNCRKGFGIKELNETRLTGEFRDYRLNGKGKGEYATGCYYEGDFVDGYFDGYGVYDCFKTSGKYATFKYKLEAIGFRGQRMGKGLKQLQPVKHFRAFGKMMNCVLKGIAKMVTVNGYLLIKTEFFAVIGQMGN
ncbi:MORN repeat protein [Leptospira kirschneri str. 200803703]|uniref:MORN repeat protein n=1 Tax=Leptospira kirschneri str. 200802841 TaxID=1193047 RepID=A0A828Y1L1_9LEPT|nr:MORN repeat protein [Leptospira kirschneri]EKO50791.1 MORN repeat protein [Leptospira kirschneri str. 200802841]EMO68237.1 MORN repeat protein [Leptospira kirschneri str. 200803703]EMO74220.1 MORN repeat protein [Leptospira kirschneri str. 200801925]